MTTITFDTLKFVKDLQAKGFAPEQAEGISDALKSVMAIAEIATKHDLKALENKLDIRMAEMSAEMKIVKWMTGATMAGVVSIVMKTFF
jgi:hypothetical protein